VSDARDERSYIGVIAINFFSTFSFRAFSVPPFLGGTSFAFLAAQTEHPRDLEVLKTHEDRQSAGDAGDLGVRFNTTGVFCLVRMLAISTLPRRRSHSRREPSIRCCSREPRSSPVNRRLS
jgi:hypothetical protein